MSDKSGWSLGHSYGDFVVTKAVAIHELNAQLIELVHTPSGAKVMHIANDDVENVFCLSFQTLPSSSNGVAHILEHTVLCGSRKYPVKDPFFAMLRRSLNTYMNALTGQDFTCYPAASQVPKDFYNLLDVYLDAVFYPNLKKLSFMQEGHRLEFADDEDVSSPLEYKGIVYNEMKGAMSSPSARLNEAVNEALFPSSTYGINSGGDPKDIVKLTYDELLSFHRDYYCPSRCLFYFYGNLPLEGHLDVIQERVLCNAEKREPLPDIPFVERYKEKKRITTSFPANDDSDEATETQIALAWLTCPLKEQDTVLALSLLDSILMDTDASPLKRLLLRSGLCKQAYSTLDNEINEVPFCLVLRGCDASKADVIEDLVFNALKNIADEGIAVEAVERTLHQLEIHRKEITGDSIPYGLTLFMRAALLKQHGTAAEVALMISSLLDKIRARIAHEPNYFNGLIRRYLLENEHFVRVVMTPSTALAAKELDDERAKLYEIKESFTGEQKNGIVNDAKTLTTFQKEQEEQDLEILPKITLGDVPCSAKDYPLEKSSLESFDIYRHNVFTNGIVYADLFFNLPLIEPTDLSALRLFTTVLPQMGSAGRSYVDTLNAMQEHTGGIGVGLTTFIDAHHPEEFCSCIGLRGKALYSKADKFFRLLRETAAEVDFSDKERLREIILKLWSALHNGLVSHAMGYASGLSASILDLPSALSLRWYGLDYYHYIQKLAENINDELDNLVNTFRALQERILQSGKAELVLGCNDAFNVEAQQQGFWGLTATGGKGDGTSDSWSQLGVEVKQRSRHGRIIASPVAFTCYTIPTVSYLHPRSTALRLAANLCDNLVLHPLIREQGGAYGGGAGCNTVLGHFYFYAYRDPNIASTLHAFQQAVDKIGSGAFDDSELEAAKLEIIQGFDNPLSPGSRADVAYMWMREKRPLALRQKIRDAVLSATKEDVIAAVEECLRPNLSKGIPVVFASRELLDKENELLKNEGKELLELCSIDEGS